MSPRFAYFYFMSGDPDRVRATVPRHVAHWSGLGLNDYLGGPFEDRTGGLITFSARDVTERSEPWKRTRSCWKAWSGRTGSNTGSQSDQKMKRRLARERRKGSGQFAVYQFRSQR